MMVQVFMVDISTELMNKKSRVKIGTDIVSLSMLKHKYLSGFDKTTALFRKLVDVISTLIRTTSILITTSNKKKGLAHFSNVKSTFDTVAAYFSNSPTSRRSYTRTHTQKSISKARAHATRFYLGEHSTFISAAYSIVLLAHSTTHSHSKIQLSQNPFKKKKKTVS